MGIDRMPLLSFGDVLSSGQESMSLSSSLLLGWLSLLSRWSFPLVELTLSDWCMMLKCFLRWGQFVTEAGLSVLIFFLGANSKLVSYTPGLRCAAIGRVWPMSGPGVLAPLISGHQPSPRPAVRLGAAISICRETDFIWITLLISDGNNGK